MQRTLFIIFALLVYLFVAGQKSVYAIGQFNTPADYVLGQDNLNKCENAMNGGSYKNGLTPFYNAIVAEGKLIIADSNSARILIYNGVPSSNNESPVNVFGNSMLCSRSPNYSNVGASAIFSAVGIKYANGKLFVADPNWHRVTIYDQIPTSDGEPASVVVGQTTFTTITANQGGTVAANTLSYAWDVEVVGTKLVVSDRNNHRVLIYNTIPTTNGAQADVVIGQPNMTSNTPNNGGISAHSLSTPTGIYSDGTKLYIAEYGNNRILVYNTLPTTNQADADFVIGQPNFTSGSANQGGTVNSNTLSVPTDIFSDNGKLFISDRGNNRVLIFNTLPTANNASADVVIGQPNMQSNTANNGGIGPQTLLNPGGVFVHEGKLLVMDYNNNRLLIYNSVPTVNFTSADIVVGQVDMYHIMLTK